MAAIPHGESLENAMHKVVSSWLTRNDPIPEPWKQTMSPIVAMPCDDVLALDTTSCRQFVSQSRSNVARLRCLYETFNGLSFVFAEKFHVSLENSKAVKNMCNLASLPNELLARILEFVVFGDRTLQNRWRAAVPLSHVCRYFRNTVLTCPVLWTDISGNSGIAALSLSRSKEAPINVSFKIDTSGSSLDFDIPVSDTLPHSKRWRTLVLRLKNNQRMQTALNMTEVCRNFGAVDAPLLEMLYILKPPGPAPYEEDGGFSQWNTPNLRHLNTVYIPFTLRGLSSLTHLTLTLLMDQSNYNNFFKGLSQMKSLEVLVLKLIAVSSARRAGEIQKFEKTELSVRRLRVEVRVGLSSTKSFIENLFSPLSFPSATSLEVRVVGEVTVLYPEEDTYETPTLSAREEIKRIVQHSGQFPLVERFSLDAVGIVDMVRNPSSWSDLKEGEIYVNVPIDRLPSLKHLLLSSNGHVDWSIPGRGMFDTMMDGTPTTRLPALETIAVTILAPAGACGFASFIARTLREQKGHGEWGTFQRLIVTTDDRSINKVGKRATATYVKDDALAWCERRNNWRPTYESPRREPEGFEKYLD